METTGDTLDELRCTAHRTPTLLRCARCDTPVCPRCAVPTEVGQKCATCAPSRGGRSRRSRVSSIVLGGAAATAVVAGVAYLGSDAFQRTKGVAPPAPVVVPEMGAEVVDQGVAFVVQRFECAVQTLEYEGERAEPDGQFCFLTVQVRNDRDGPAVFSGDEQYLVDVDGRRFDFDLQATFAYARPTEQDLEELDIFVLSELGPGDETEGVLVFDVPQDAEIAEAELHAIVLDDFDRIFPSARGVRTGLRPTPATTTSTPASRP